VRKISLSS